MKIQILSDLHLELDRSAPDTRTPSRLWTIPATDADVVVLAGDIDTGVRGVAWAASQARRLGKPFIYVMGNHEYYGHAYPGLLDEAREIADRGSVYLLERGEVLVNEVRFLGCTLWTDFALRHRQSSDARLCQDAMNDFRRIRMGETGRRMEPEYLIHLHHISRRWLAERMNDLPEVPTVVVTHHAPHPESLGFGGMSDPISAGCASDCADLMGSPARLWVHGHVHRASDYRIRGTRVVCNPRGYSPDGFVPGFRADRVLRV